MKTFKEFLLEVEEVEGMSKKKKLSTEYKDEEHLQQHGAKHISTTPSGHKVYQTGTKGSVRKEYHAVNPDTKKVDVSIDGDEHNGVMSKILLKANEGNTIKAHEFLHHLTTHHNKTMKWDMHSPGGKAVVQKLAKMKGVSSHGWAHGKPVNITADDDELTHGPAAHRKNTPEEDEARKMVLVTHKT